MEASVQESLLKRIADGDSGAVRGCIDRFGGLVWSIVRKRRLDAQEAEDLVQEIFIDIWKSAERYDPNVASETAFVAMIARRRVIDRLRSRARRPEVEPPTDVPVEPLATEWSDEAAAAAEAMARLSEGQRRVLHLAFGQGLTYEAIASVTGMPHGTVKTHARRGLIRLREHLGVVPTGGGS